MLNIQEQNKDLKLTEYVCSECEKWFLVKDPYSDELVCPFCGLVAHANGDFNISKIELNG